MGRASGHNALVLGGTGRVGSEVARALASAGMQVVVQYRSRDDLASALLPTLHGGGHIAVACDLLDPKSLGGLFTNLSAAGREADVLVNCMHVQFTPRELANSVFDEDWSGHISAMRVHVEACRLALIGMRRRGFGRIIYISGSLAARPLAGCGPYAAAKGGIHAFQRVLALEVGRHRVTVNAVAPCRVQPDDNREATEHPEEWSTLNEGVEQSSALTNDPRAMEVADTVAFLASEKASAITGQVVYLARGQVMLG